MKITIWAKKLNPGFVITFQFVYLAFNLDGQLRNNQKLMKAYNFQNNENQLTVKVSTYSQAAIYCSFFVQKISREKREME